MIIDEAFNSDKLIELLEALIKDAKRKVFLILDQRFCSTGHPWTAKGLMENLGSTFPKRQRATPSTNLSTQKSAPMSTFQTLAKTIEEGSL